MDPTDLAFAGLARQAELIRAGEVSSRELVELYLERIERIDPQLNAFVRVLAERALADADQADARREAGDERPLLGVPIAVKDNHDLAGEVTAHGTAAFDEPAAADCELVRRLREAGAVVLGKTHLPELAIIGATESPTFGASRATRGTRTAPRGGSSGGSGAAVAAGLCAVATASDGGGSIRIPAACCGLFGLKPQRGRVSLMPLPEHWYGMSVAGCVTRTRARHGAVPRRRQRPGRRATRDVRRAAAESRSSRLARELARRAADRRLDQARSRAGPVHERGEGARWPRRPSCCARSATRCRDHDPAYGELELPVFLPRYLRGIRDEARSACPAPSASSGAPGSSRRWARSIPSAVHGVDAAATSRRQAARIWPALRRARRAAHPDDRQARPCGSAEWEGKGALAHAPRAWRRAYPFTGAWNAHRPARRRRSRPASPTTACRSRSS